MIKIKQPVIVEGKYDKIKLENIIDALIIPTNGFGIFKNIEKRELIRTLAEKYGVIVLTDSDNAGNMIRSYIKRFLGQANIINVYIPQVKGKEKRKDKSGKEGLLGVEGMTDDVILDALKRSGIDGETIKEKTRKISKTDLFCAGLSGRENSSENRINFLKYISLPVNLSPNAMLDILNTLYTTEEFKEVIIRWQSSTDKS